MSPRKFPKIGLRELRELVGRKMADRVKIEPVYLLQLRMWVGWMSDNTYELFPMDALSHYENRPVCEKVNLVSGGIDYSDNYLISQTLLRCYNESNVFLSA